jgi:peptide/nickel transport system substrate-binding protein
VDVIDAVPAENIPELQQTKGINIVRAPNEMSAYIQLNCAKEPFNNVKVRQALNYAINRDAIVKGVMLGAGEPQVGFLSPAHEGYDPNLKPYAYNPDKARQLLEQAGYPKGFKFTLAGPTARYYKDKEILQAVASQLEAVGLTVDLKIMDWGAYIGEFIKKPPVFDAAMIGYGDGGTAFTALNMAVYSKANAAGYYGYKNSEFDSLYEKALGTLDTQQRAGLVRQMRQILYEEAPFIYVAAQQVIYAIRDNVHDFYPMPEGNFWLREGQGAYVSSA